MFSDYASKSLRRDVVAGVTVAAIAVPQAMAYAMIAGVDPKFGLYSAIVVTALASIFGSSSHLINGPTNAISLVVFSALAFLEPDHHDAAIQAMFLLAIMAGAIQIVIALFRLGDLTRYISDSVVLGFMAGAGMLIALSQIANLLGIQDKGGGHQHLLYRLYLTLTTGGPVKLEALWIGCGTIVMVIAARSITRKYRLPRLDMLGTLILVAIVAAVMGWTNPDEHGKSIVPVVPPVPASLPAFHMPVAEWEWVRQMSGSAVAVSLLGLLEALTIAKSISHRTGEPLDYNRQCLAEGIANLTGGFFQCLPGSGSLTRSAINYQSGAVTRWSGVFAAAAVGLVVVLCAPLSRFIPKAALAGILMVTAAGLVDWARLRYAVRASRYDAALVLATAVSAVLLGVEFSILIGAGMSILLYVPRAARLQAEELVVDSQRVVRERRPDDPRCTEMVIYDFEGELFFGAAWELDRYLSELRARVDAGARVLVLRLKRTRNPDVVCMERLQSFLQEMIKRDVVTLLCGVRPEFAHAMHNLGFEAWLPTERVFFERGANFSSTLAGVRYAYDLLGVDKCGHCPRRDEPAGSEGEFYYMI
jgi:SulP family sulfate permease